jgi:hypothetical protein
MMIKMMMMMMMMIIIIHHCQTRLQRSELPAREACPHVDRERSNLPSRCCEKGAVYKHFFEKERKSHNSHMARSTNLLGWTGGLYTAKRGRML